MNSIQLPADPEQIAQLRIGDSISVTGTVVTARDAAHHYIWHELVHGDPSGEDLEIYSRLKRILHRGIIYHAGPIMKRSGDVWKCISAGPTTSIREESYEADIIREFNLAGVIGKGGMGEYTHTSLCGQKAVYLNAVGGAGALAARCIAEAVEVLKPGFGIPEAMWVLEITDFPAVVTMDSAGSSLHRDIEDSSSKRFHEMYPSQ